MGLILAGHQGNIAQLVKYGDPLVGWRGDPTMDTYLDENTGQVEVHAFDSHGERYCACTVNAATDPGWRHTLLRQLTEWDPRRVNVVDKFSQEQEARAAAKKRADRNVIEERADKLAWALRRDIGHDVDGLSKEFY